MKESHQVQATVEHAASRLVPSTACLSLIAALAVARSAHASASFDFNLDPIAGDGVPELSAAAMGAFAVGLLGIARSLRRSKPSPDSLPPRPEIDVTPTAEMAPFFVALRQAANSLRPATRDSQTPKRTAA